MKHLVLAIITLLMGCTSTPKSFERTKDGYRHTSSKVFFASNLNDWKITDDVPAENLSSQIELAVLYAYSSSKEFKPYATVYVVNGENPLASVQARASSLMPNAKLSQQKLTKTASGPAHVEIYKFTPASEQKSGLVSAKKPTNVESWFIQSKSAPHLVFWVTINADAKDEKNLPFQFVDDFLVANKAHQ